MICKKCNVKMVQGTAIKSQFIHGERPFGWPGYINHKTIKIIDCLRCPKCGHSDDNKTSKYE